MIARAHGISLDALVRANPHKRTTIVDGQRTFQTIGIGEPLNVGVGDAASDAINAVIFAGGPCLQANVALVCAAQALLGVTVDGKWGSNTSAAARSHVPSAPGACYPRPLWWPPVGVSACPSMSVPVAPTAIPVATTSTQTLAPAAVLALGTINPCDQSSVPIVCAAQRALGVTVDGKYGTATASAAARLFPGAPPACSPRPAWWAPVGQSNCVVSPTASTQPAPVMAPTATAAPSAVAALATINPCLQANVAIVYAAQKALGVAQDGKYGSVTAAAAQKVLPSAPAACSPRPTWWAPAGQVNPIPSTAVAVPAITTAPTAQAPAHTTTSSTTTTTSTTTTAPTSEAVTAPTKKKLSTGAMVGIGVGAAALVGLVAMAAHKPTRRRAIHGAKRAHKAAKKHIRRRR